MIDPRALVHPDAVVGDGVAIGPCCVVEAGARIGAGCRLHAHAVVRADVEIEAGVTIDSFVVVGGDAQMRTPDPTAAHGRVVIGARSILREHVTVHRPAKSGGSTIVGPDCFLMANSHVAHDCRLEAFVTMANNAMLGGHVTVGAHAFVGGGAGIHQFVRVGTGAMVGGNASLSYDVPPFTIATERNEVVGLNLVGLRRRNVPAASVQDLKDCFRAVLGRGDARAAASAAIAAGTVGTSPEGAEFLRFFVGGHRGFCQRRRRRRGESVADAE